MRLGQVLALVPGTPEFAVIFGLAWCADCAAVHTHALLLCGFVARYGLLHLCEAFPKPGYHIVPVCFWDILIGRYLKRPPQFRVGRAVGHARVVQSGDARTHGGLMLWGERLRAVITLEVR